ncbi:uncharacterized protein [Miscanthus floridulus]|uniref:uncharacterized protein n=1 Tax=Miscanthus floridulus TaxID=154761 RepID=UPI0034579DD4
MLMMPMCCIQFRHYKGDYTYAWMVAAGTRIQEAATDDSYPNEMMQVELSMQLVLTDSQLQMWFCHCRLKDWKSLLAKIAQLAQGLQMHYWQRYITISTKVTR